MFHTFLLSTLLEVQYFSNRAALCLTTFVQGTHDGEAPFGTPLAYSTNDATAVEYQPYNKYGSGYWMVQLLVDCTKTDQGWFEIKVKEVTHSTRTTCRLTVLMILGLHLTIDRMGTRRQSEYLYRCPGRCGTVLIDKSHC